MVLIHGSLRIIRSYQSHKAQNIVLLLNSQRDVAKQLWRNSLWPIVWKETLRFGWFRENRFNKATSPTYQLVIIGGVSGNHASTKMTNHGSYIGRVLHQLRELLACHPRWRSSWLTSVSDFVRATMKTKYVLETCRSNS